MEEKETFLESYVLVDIVAPSPTLVKMDVQEITCQCENMSTWYFTGQ